MKTKGEQAPITDAEDLSEALQAFHMLAVEMAKLEGKIINRETVAWLNVVVARLEAVMLRHSIEPVAYTPPEPPK